MTADTRFENYLVDLAVSGAMVEGEWVAVGLVQRLG